MDNRKKYMIDTYAKYWITARDTVYGLTPYDKCLINKINDLAQKTSASSILEVAIGTGEPIASSLVEFNYKIHGIDISDILIEALRNKHSEIDAKVGDAENLPYYDSEFDMTYCVHSSWFIPNFKKAIFEMKRVTKQGGVMLFDIQNIHNKYIMDIYKQHLFENKNIFGMLYKIMKNSAKFILNKGTQDWPFIVSQTPTDPIELKNFLIGLKVKNIDIFSWGENRLTKLSDNRLEGCPRLVFIVVI